MADSLPVRAELAPAVSDAPPGQLSDAERAQALRLKYQLAAQRDEVVRRRVAAAQQFGPGSPEVAQMRQQELDLGQRIVDLHRGTAPRQTPDQMTQSRASLQAQYPGAVAQMRGQYNTDVQAAQAPIDARERASRFFLAPPNSDPREQATTQYGLDLDRQSAEAGQDRGLRSVIEQSQVRRLADATAARDAYNPPAELKFDSVRPPDVAADQAARSEVRRLLSSQRESLQYGSDLTRGERELSLARLEDEKSRAAIGGRAAEAGVRGMEADVSGKEAAADLTRAETRRKIAEAEALGPAQATQAKREAAKVQANFDPNQWMQNLQQFNQVAESASGPTAALSPGEQDQKLQAYINNVVIPLEDLSKYDPQAAAQYARRAMDMFPATDTSMLTGAGLLSPLAFPLIAPTALPAALGRIFGQRKLMPLRERLSKLTGTDQAPQ